MIGKILTNSIAGLIFTGAVTAQIAAGGAYTLEKSVVATGGGESSNGAFSLNGTAGQNIAGANSSGSTLVLQSGFWAEPLIQPTAATAAISGKVTGSNGRGIHNARVTLTYSNGATRTVLTDFFGFYKFTEVEISSIYIITASAKWTVFTNAAQVVEVNGDLTGLNFTAID